MTSPVEIQAELEAAAKGLDAASTKYAQTLKEFEGAGEELGPGLKYQIAVQTELIAIYDHAIDEGKRPPAEDIRRALAERNVRATDPDLFADYQRLSTEMDALRIWISARKASISARQSILRGERG